VTIECPGIVGLITKMPREWAEPQRFGWFEPFVMRLSITPDMGDESSGVTSAGPSARNSGSAAMPSVTNKMAYFSFSRVNNFPSQLRPPPQRIGKRHRGGSSSSLPTSMRKILPSRESERTLPRNPCGRTRITTLFNDRTDAPIYYHESKEAFYFQPKPKAILAVA